ncbi:LANO_0H11056g1_1 [Lachancea nothofagi CBS 11611]|uniref:LANO_0H11056g1_1 n=1 Tax=Lachancea nothofagi CBS 11611 TaxID=1266666 RepID=A0A1G4KM93_9SACH|nr:LANO_0H11056g1_1 [Lachancea nothofagi CBS 11611]
MTFNGQMVDGWLGGIRRLNYNLRELDNNLRELFYNIFSLKVTYCLGILIGGYGIYHSLMKIPELCFTNHQLEHCFTNVMTSVVSLTGTFGCSLILILWPIYNEMSAERAENIEVGDLSIPSIGITESGQPEHATIITGVSSSTRVETSSTKGIQS